METKTPKIKPTFLEASKIRNDSYCLLGLHQLCFFYQNEMEITEHQEAQNLAKRLYFSSTCCTMPGHLAFRCCLPCFQPSPEGRILQALAPSPAACVLASGKQSSVGMAPFGDHLAGVGTLVSPFPTSPVPGRNWGSSVSSQCNFW